MGRLPADRFPQVRSHGRRRTRRVGRPVVGPDYTKIFVTQGTAGPEGIDRIIQTKVGLEDVLAGLKDDDFRLRDAALAATRGN